MDVSKKGLKRLFPHLTSELESNSGKVRIRSVRSNAEDSESKSHESFSGYDPDVIDFIRRCDTEQEAEEIIQFMERRGEIKKEYADKLRGQLREKGVRSFGSKKTDDYYLKLGGYD